MFRSVTQEGRSRRRCYDCFAVSHRRRRRCRRKRKMLLKESQQPQQRAAVQMLVCRTITTTPTTTQTPRSKLQTWSFAGYSYFTKYAWTHVLTDQHLVLVYHECGYRDLVG